MMCPEAPYQNLPPHITLLMEVDTRAIASNYNTLKDKANNSLCAAVLKADAYGFGLEPVARTLFQEGCSHFFVAHPEEGLALRQLLKEPHIYVLSGVLPGTTELFRQEKLTPVLTDYGMVQEWAREAKKAGEKLPCVLHVDTGMHRSGFDRKDQEKLVSAPDALENLDVQLVMSHLVASANADNPLNKAQNQEFQAFCQHFPGISKSLADTGGIFLGDAFQYDMVRPGKGLFGLYPSADLKQCLTLSARILQVRTASQGETVGYDGTYTLARDSDLATLGVGFADGYDRRLSNTGYVDIQGFKAPIVGRISMDYTVVDVTDVPSSLRPVGGWVDLVSETLTLDDLAQQTGTISRELSTGLGHRWTRVHR